MRGIFGRCCFRGDFQVRSGIGYPIHKLETFQHYVIGLKFHIPEGQKK
jgi:hypothetical protein